MERRAGLARLPLAASAVMISLATSRPSRRWSYSLPILLVTVVLGVALLLGPATASHGIFQLLLLLVLVVALGLGLGPALLAAGLGVAAGLAGTQFVRPEDGAQVGAEVGLFAAEGAVMAFVGGIVRAAIGVAVQSAVEWPAQLSSSSRGESTLIEPLTTREVEVLRAAAGGRSASELADELCLSVNTVKTHLAHCYDKLGAHNRAEAIAVGLRCGCLEPADLHKAALDANSGALAVNGALRPRITRGGEATGQPAP